MRRPIITFLALLPLGIALSAAVAIASGVMVTSESLRVTSSGYSVADGPDHYGWYVQVKGGKGKRQAISHYLALPSRYRYREARTAQQAATGWMHRLRTTLNEGDRIRCIDVACGWPAPMLAGSAELDSGARIIATHSLVLTPDNAGALPVYGYELRGIPMRPIWWGVAVNGALYALALWLALAGVLWMRRQRRMRRNVCHRCLYDLRGGPHAHCPECGVATAWIKAQPGDSRLRAAALQGVSSKSCVVTSSCASH